MRKLKLQMHISLDGFVAGPEGQLDWMTWVESPDLIDFIIGFTDSCDTILMGRKMTTEFVNYWEGVKPDSPEYVFAERMVEMPKIIFSKTVSSMEGKNVRVENGDLVTAVNELKKMPGKDMVVYGGAGFVSSLIENDLVDELNLFVNPTAIGEGMRIFKGRKAYKRIGSVAYQNGIVVNTYEPVKQ